MRRFLGDRRLDRVELMPRPAVAAAMFAAFAIAACGGGSIDSPARTADGSDDAAHPRGADRSTSNSIRFVDAAGREHELERPAGRIVSLVPSATETLRALGAEQALVGRTDYDREAWVADIPSVGGGLEPNLEAVLALEPDVVIRFEGEQDPRTPARLDALGIRHVGVRPVSLEDIFETNRIVGRLTGRDQAADSLTRAIRAGLRALEQATADLPRRRVVYVLGGSPPWVAGPDTYISEILGRLGAVNVFADLGSEYAAVSPEELRSRDIDVVLTAGPNTYDRSLTPGARVEVVGDALQVPGPSVVREARTIAERLHARSIR